MMTILKFGDKNENWYDNNKKIDMHVNRLKKKINKVKGRRYDNLFSR